MAGFIIATDMQDKEVIQQLKHSSVGFIRARINQLINSLGITASDTTARLTTLFVIVALGLNIFFLLNLAIGYLIGEALGSVGLGFLCLVGFYTLLLIIYLVVQASVEARVRNNVARKVHHISDNINGSLNRIESMRVETPYREAYISGEPQPYNALRLRYNEAAKQTSFASGELIKGAMYVRHNYMKVFGSIAQASVPGYKYASPIIGLFGSNKAKSSTATRGKTQGQPAVLNFIENHLSKVKPYMPYISAAYTYLSPVLTAFFIGRSQSWLLGKLFGWGRKKKK